MWDASGGRPLSSGAPGLSCVLQSCPVLYTFPSVIFGGFQGLSLGLCPSEELSRNDGYG